MMKKIFHIVFFICVFEKANSQEVLFPLHSNPVIKEFIRHNPIANNNTFRLTSVALPFTDDFSGSRIYPNTVLWADSDAFVNSTMCDNPVTVGVATLDGIDKEGNPHDSLSGQTRICDSLSSQEIDLGGLVASDSVYFSFFYQPQGLADEPEQGDSLVLQFLDNGAVWHNMWVHDGIPDSVFTRVNFHISSAAFLHAGFRFRFYNYATPNGNRDHWHIDYVYLNKNRELNDLLRDIGFVNTPTTLLNEYHSMPWTHYKYNSNPAGLMKTEYTDSIRNVGISPYGNIRYDSDVFDDQGNLLHNWNDPSTDVYPGIVYPFEAQVLSTFFYPSTPSDLSADFLVRNKIDSIGTIFNLRENDTVKYVQHFENYYAYDDGSAESSYGISVAYSSMAFRFDVKRQDTLRGIQIYFNPSGLNVHLDLFSLCYWSNVNVANNTANLVYKRIDMKPANIDSINGFATYFFDTLLIVNGTIYVGIIQNTADLLGIGVDRNNDSHNNMFINYNNHWYQSAITGTWMMRPFFGRDLTIGLEETVSLFIDFDVFPNPANDRIIVTRRSQTADGGWVEIHNALGQKIFRTALFRNRQEIDVSGLPDGIYFIIVHDDQDRLTGSKKIIIQHRH